jgi:hypothetical protein
MSDKTNVHWHCPNCSHLVTANVTGGDVACDGCKHAFTIPAWPGESVCWYCRQQPIGERCWKFNLYDVVSNRVEGFLSKTQVVEYVQKSVDVPVCVACFTAQKKWKPWRSDGTFGRLLSNAMPLFVVFGFIGLIGGIAILNFAGPSARQVGLAIVAGSVCAILALVGMALMLIRNELRLGQAMRGRMEWDEVEEYPPLKELLRQGYRFGTKPPG